MRELTPRTRAMRELTPRTRAGGEIGRRKGLKIPRWQHRAGSSPAPGTNKNSELVESMMLNIGSILF